MHGRRREFIYFFLSLFLLQAKAIAEDIGYPSYIKNPSKLAAKVKGVSYCCESQPASLNRWCAMFLNSKKQSFFNTKWSGHLQITSVCRHSRHQSHKSHLTGGACARGTGTLLACARRRILFRLTHYLIGHSNHC